MTYIENMAIEIHIDCIHEDPDDQYEILKTTEKLINQVIADTKRACIRVVKLEHGNYPLLCKLFELAIDQAEVKEE